MVSPQLIEYVRQQFAAGVSKEEITNQLSANGWQEGDITEVVSLQFNPKPLAVSSVYQTPVHTPSQIAGPKSGAGKWVIVIIVVLLIGAGGAFAAYYYGFFSSPTPPVTAPTPPLTNTVSTTTLPSVPLPVLASSTPQLPLNMATSSTTALDANAALTLPTASLTVNNASSTIATASTVILKWSSTNADTFSATESVSNCLISVMDKPDTTLNIMSSARGTNSSLSFTKNDLALLSGCAVTITYIAENIKTAQTAQAAVSISFPNTDATLAQLISMTSLGKSSLTIPTAPATTPLSPPSIPPTSPMTLPITTPMPPVINTTSTTTTRPPPPVIPPLP